MRLFDRFDKVYCINLPHRTDRKNNFITEVKKYDLGQFEFFNAFYGKDLPNPHNLNVGCVGLIKSNLEIFKQSILDDIDTVAIIEDDCYFTDEVRNIQSYYDQLPDDWDMLYYGGNHNYHCTFCDKPIEINDKILKLQYTFSTHFVIIRKKLFKPIVDLISGYHQPIDVVYTLIQKTNNVYSFNPSIARQISGYSDIEDNFVNYDTWIK